MKKKFFEAHRSIIKKVSCLALAAVVVAGGIAAYRSTQEKAPELPVFVDQSTVSISEDEVPLAVGKTTTTKKTTTKTTTKKTNMKTKAKKNSTTTKKSTKTTNKTKTTSTQQIKTNTKVVTTVTTKLKKNSKVKTVTTKVVTTVTTTTTVRASQTASNTSNTSTGNSNAAAGTYKVRSVAPKTDARVLNAFEQIGCTVVVNPKVSYSGCFDASARTITLKTLDGTVYHELGHFVEFVGGTATVKQQIAAAYNTEKSKYTAYNRAYVLQNSSEYFAESFRNYCENPAALKASRPNTYNAIVSALNAMTSTRVNTLISVYSSVWR